MVKLTKVAEGSESDIYKTKIFNSDIIVKYRRDKSYLIPQINDKLRVKRNKKEAKLMIMASDNGISVPKVILFDKYSIYMTFIEGETLNNMDLGEVNESVPYDIGKSLYRMHSSGIVHNDFTSANIIVKDGEPFIIDFGLSDISYDTEERAIDLLLMKSSVDEKFFSEILKGYKYHNEFYVQVLDKLRSIERRGRYQTRSLEDIKVN